MEQLIWQKPDNSKQALFDTQKKTLDTLRDHGAISQQQYEVSLHGLAQKLGISFN